MHTQVWWETPLECRHMNEMRDNIKIHLTKTGLKDKTNITFHCPVFIYNRTINNVQKHNICINVPSSQTFRSYLKGQELDCILSGFGPKESFGIISVVLD
jgi:hypothetical protein